MEGQRKFIGGLLVGAGLAYLLDPDRGPRRRALVRDKASSAGHRLVGTLDATARDLRNRAGGVAAEVRGRLRREYVGDEILHERVRSAIGRVVTHPGSIQVTVAEGRVTLQGQVLEDELDDLLATGAKVRGVVELVNELEVHPTPGDQPSLQRGGRRGRNRSGQQNWSPTTRVAVGVIGGGLLASALTDFPAGRRASRGERRWGINVQKVINVAAPIEQVWELWSHYENFPRFMSHLESVRSLGEGRSHWVAIGPAGTRVSWDAITTEWKPNECMAWRSVPGATVENEGRVRFRPTADGGTQIEVRMSYSPPGGAVGHAVASLFGTDPKHAMDADMVRLKSLLEEGRTSTEQGTVERDEVATSR